MSSPDPGIDLATTLAGTLALLTPPGGSVALTLGANLFSGPERESDEWVGNQIVNVLKTGGPPPQPIMGVGENVFQARVQIMVRSKVDQFASGEALARACLRYLHTRAISGYVDVLAQSTEPDYLGPDERQVHRWSSNLLVRWVE